MGELDGAKSSQHRAHGEMKLLPKAGDFFGAGSVLLRPLSSRKQCNENENFSSACINKDNLLVQSKTTGATFNLFPLLS